MKKLLGLLAVAPLAIASCTTEAAEAQTFTVLLDKDGAEVEYTVEINEHSDYFIDYIFSNQIDVEFELSHSSWGYSVNAIDGVAHSCESDGYKGSYWQFLEDGTSASFGISSLEPKAGSTYEFNNNGDWCSFDWDSMGYTEAASVNNTDTHKISAKLDSNTSGFGDYWGLVQSDQTGSNPDKVYTDNYNGFDFSQLKDQTIYDFLIKTSADGSESANAWWYTNIEIIEWREVTA